MVALGAQPRALYDKLRLDESDLDVSYHAIKRLCRRLRKARPVREQDVALHVVVSGQEFRPGVSSAPGSVPPGGLPRQERRRLVFPGVCARGVRPRSAFCAQDAHNSQVRSLIAARAVRVRHGSPIQSLG